MYYAFNVQNNENGPIVNLSGLLKNHTQQDRRSIYSRLQSRHDIRVLDISDNRMNEYPNGKGGEFRREPERCVRHRSTPLEVLYYYHNPISSTLKQEASIIADIISKNYQLRTLDVSDCDLRDTGIAIILGAITDNHKDFEVLNVAGNNIFQGKTLAEFIVKNKTLKYLHYEGPRVDGSTYDTINFSYSNSNNETLNGEKPLISFHSFTGPNRTYAWDRQAIHDAINNSQAPIFYCDVEQGFQSYSQKIATNKKVDFDNYLQQQKSDISRSELNGFDPKKNSHV